MISQKEMISNPKERVREHFRDVPEVVRTESLRTSTPSIEVEYLRRYLNISGRDLLVMLLKQSKWSEKVPQFAFERCQKKIQIVEFQQTRDSFKKKTANLIIYHSYVWMKDVIEK